MNKNFLIGNFLTAYGRKFGQVARPPAPGQGLSRDRLADRFRARAISYRTRRADYVRGVQLGLVGALLLTIAAFNFDINPTGDQDFAMAQQELVMMEEIVQTQQLEKPPPPPRPPVPVEVPNDAILDDADLELDSLLDLDEVLTALPPPPAPVEEEVDEDPEVFFVVEQMPDMVGGMAALLSDLTYPAMARKAGLEGVVVVQIVIDETGTARTPTIIKSVHKILDDEAVQAVLAQRFTPGRQRGRPVTVAMNIPVTFRLN
jgi:periplasmic protein TonB